MGRLLVITGRGGVGKSTFAALCVRHLPRPMLLIDADPDQSLAALLGVDLEEAGVRTISDALYRVQKRDGEPDLEAMPLPERIRHLLNVSCLYEGAGFDLLTLGVKWTRGCYCQPNNLLQGLIPSLAAGYGHVVLDSPAGLEHVNRRLVTEVDDAFVMVDPSAKALRNAHRVRELAEAVGVRIGRLWLVGNHRFGPEAEGELRGPDEAAYAGRVEPDPAVQDSDWQGRSLLELPDDSPAVTSVGRVLARAGVL